MSHQAGGTPEIKRGAEVFASDSAPLGRVNETRPEHFQVDPAESGGAFWLRRSDVASTTEERVIVTFVRDELDEHKGSDPGAVGAVGATSEQRAFIPGATPSEANDLFDPQLGDQA